MSQHDKQTQSYLSQFTFSRCAQEGPLNGSSCCAVFKEKRFRYCSRTAFLHMLSFICGGVGWWWQRRRWESYF